MLFGQRNAITRLIPTGEDCPDVILPIQGVKGVKAVEFDPLTQLIYWVRPLLNIDFQSYCFGMVLSNYSKTKLFVYPD